MIYFFPQGLSYNQYGKIKRLQHYLTINKDCIFFGACTNLVSESTSISKRAVRNILLPPYLARKSRKRRAAPS